MDLSLEEKFAKIFKDVQPKRHPIDRSMISLDDALLADYFVENLRPSVIEQHLTEGKRKLMVVHDFLVKYQIANNVNRSAVIDFLNTDSDASTLFA